MEKTPDCDLLREMIGFATERLMELEVAAATGAAYGERSPLRTAQSNGYRERDWQTRAGIVCASSSSGMAPISPGFLEPRLRMAEKALTAVIQEPTSRVSRPARSRSGQAMGMSRISKSQVSWLYEDIDGKVKASFKAPSRATRPTYGSTLPT